MTKVAKKLMVLVAVTALASLLPVSEATAMPTLTLDNGIATTPTGTVAYDVVGGAVTGVGIGFDTITGVGTSNDGDFACLGCVLRFTSGSNVINGPDDWEWGHGAVGSFAIIGRFPFGAGTGPNAVLLSGQIEVVKADSFNGQVTVQAFGFDEKHDVILDWFGMTDSDFTFHSTNIAANATINVDGTFSGDLTEADVTNRPRILEPATGLLLLLGLSGLAAYRRRT
jgi:hypothetical protein